MAKDSRKIVVGAGGTISRAPVGTVLPATPTASLNGAFSDLGFVNDDGATLGHSVSTENVMAWQSLDAVRVLKTGRELTIAFALLEWKRETFTTAFGGGTWTEPTAGVYRYTPPTASDKPLESALILTFNDGIENHRFLFPRVVLDDGGVETTINKNAVAELPVTMRALAPDDGSDIFVYLSDAGDSFVQGS